MLQKLQEDVADKENKTNVKVELQDLKMDLWNTKIELTKLRKDKDSFRLKVLHHGLLWKYILFY